MILCNWTYCPLKHRQGLLHSNQENIEVEQNNQLFWEHIKLALERVQSEKKTKNQGIFDEKIETEVENPVVKLPIAVMANNNRNQNDAEINAYMDLKAKLNMLLTMAFFCPFIAYSY